LEDRMSWFNHNKWALVVIAVVVSMVLIAAGVWINSQKPPLYITDGDETIPGSFLVQTHKFNPDDFSVSGSTVSLSRARNIILTAQGGTPSTTSGCAEPIVVEFGTNKVDTYFLDFDSTSDEYAFWCNIVLPDEYGTGGVYTMTARFYWTCSGGTGAVTWGIQSRAYADSDAIDQAWGTAVWINDSCGTTNDVCITSETSAMTIAGSPAGGNLACFRVVRDADDSEGLGDTLAFDARLMAVKLVFSSK